MPNQYTKFKATLETGQPYEFRFKKCHGPRQRKQKNTRSNTVPDRARHQHWRDELYTPDTVLIYTPSNGLRIDPFKSYPVRPNQAELSVLDHFLCHLAPSSNQNVTLTGRPSSIDTDPHVKFLLPYVLHEAPLFDALLATCQASIMLSSGASAYHDEFFVFHRGRAMAGLRKQLEHEADVSAMLAVTMLITCDYLTGDVDAVTGHAKALERMLLIRGKLPQRNVWEKFISKGVNVYRTISFMATGGKPNASPERQLDVLIDPLLPLDYPQPPFSTEQCAEWSKLPRGFCDLILASSLSTQLILLITVVHEIIPGIGKHLNDTLTTTGPIQAALQRFLQHNDATMLERIVASGLIAYIFQWPRIMSPNLFHDPPMKGITALLANPHGIQAGYERDMLVWTHVVVEGFAFHRSSRLPGTRDVYVKALRKHSIMQDWSKLVPLLENFFCTPELLVGWKLCHTDCLRTYPDFNTETSTSSPVTSVSAFELQKESSSICPFSGRRTPASESRCPFSQLALDYV